jgi:uncharacterized protein (TIGR00369 family)
MLDPVISAAIHESFGRQGAMRAIGAHITTLDEGWCVIDLPLSPAVTQQHGYFHGGVVGALADTAGGYAANTRLMPARECLTAEYKINMLSPAQGERLEARARVIRGGRTLIVVSVDVFAVSAKREQHCALAQMTLFGIDARAVAVSSNQGRTL